MRFAFLEDQGVRVAALSERAGGDFRFGGAGQARIERWAGALGAAPGGLVRGEQIHGTRVVEVELGDAGRGFANTPPFPATDGLATQTPGLGLVISVADCAPVFLAAPEHHAIALVHAGREGTRNRAAARGVEVLNRAYGVPPHSILALIGPSAGPCCYEVDPDTARGWTSEGWPADGRRLDLWETNRAQLEAVGVPPRHIEVSGICTICDARFHSHRRHRDGQRNVALMAL